MGQVRPFGVQIVFGAPKMPGGQPLSQYSTDYKLARGNGGLTEPDVRFTQGRPLTIALSAGGSSENSIPAACLGPYVRSQHGRRQSRNQLNQGVPWLKCAA